MKCWLSALVVLAATVPAFAQDDAIYAPCLQQFPTPEEVGDASAYVAAMQDAGWTHHADGPDRDLAAVPLGELHAALITFHGTFDTVDRAQAFADRAFILYRDERQFVEVFTREGVSAAVSAVDTNPQLSRRRITVRCTFAGPSLGGVDALISQGEILFDDLAVEFVAVDVDEPEKTLSLNVAAARFVEDEAILAPLSVRQGIDLRYIYEPPE